MNGRIIALTLGLLLGPPIAPAVAQSTPPPITEQEAHAIGVDAYVYLYPLVTMDISRKTFTNIEPGKEFYPAEAYHQDYLTLHPSQPYIAINDLPKIQALKEVFPDSYRENPVLVAAVQSAR